MKLWSNCGATSDCVRWVATRCIMSPPLFVGVWLGVVWMRSMVPHLPHVMRFSWCKEALVDSSRLQWVQQRLQILLGQWGQPVLHKKIKNSADKSMIRGVNVVINHLKGVLDFVNTHHMDLTAIISRTFLKDVGQSLAWILTDTSDKSGYKSLLRLEGDSAQKMLNFLQTVCHVTAQYYKSHYLQAARLFGASFFAEERHYRSPSATFEIIEAVSRMPDYNGSWTGKLCVGLRTLWRDL